MSVDEDGRPSAGSRYLAGVPVLPTLAEAEERGGLTSDQAVAMCEIAARALRAAAIGGTASRTEKACWKATADAYEHAAGIIRAIVPA